MRRKVIKQGHNTLTVTIPTNWAQKNEISAGDDVFIEESDSSLSITKAENHKVLKEITVNIDGFNYFVLSRHLAHLYRTDYSKITILYSNDEIYSDKLGKYIGTKDTIIRIIKRFVGAEIISQTSNKIEIECLIPQTESDDELDKIERRIYYILKETLNELALAMNKNFSVFSNAVYDYHDNVTKFINYYLRELYLSKKSEYEKKTGYAFYLLMETLIDQIRHLCESIDENGCSEKARTYVKDIFQIFLDEYNMIITNRNDLPELMQNRYKLKSRMKAEKFTVKDIKVISEILFYLETFNISSEYLFVREMAKNK